MAREASAHSFSLDLYVNNPATMRKLARLINSWLTAMNQSEVSGVVFLNIKKAFDLVDHDILLKMLTIYIYKNFLTRILDHPFNHIFIIECKASYSMALSLLNTQ